MCIYTFKKQFFFFLIKKFHQLHCTTPQNVPILGVSGVKDTTKTNKIEDAMLHTGRLIVSFSIGTYLYDHVKIIFNIIKKKIFFSFFFVFFKIVFTCSDFTALPSKERFPWKKTLYSTWHASIFVSFCGILYTGDAYFRTLGVVAHPLEEFFYFFLTFAF